MTCPRLLLVTDSARASRPLPELAAAAVAGGVDALYLRHLATDDDRGAEVRQFRDRLGPDVLLMVPGSLPSGIVNVGLHLRERDPLPVSSDRTAPGIVSRAVHTPAEAARSGSVNYLVCGHVFASASKPGRPPIGVHGLARVVTAAPCPVVAIGGITPEHVPAVVAAGARGVAVIGAICEADDPRAAAQALRTAVDTALADHQKGLAMNHQTVTTLTIIVNGKPREIPAGSTVHDLLASRNLADSMAIVERNGVILPRVAYGETVLERGDSLEVVHAVGGG